MEDEFKSTITALVLFVAFSWLILTVAVDFGAEYGKSADEIGDGSLDIQVFKHRQKVLIVQHRDTGQDLMMVKLMTLMMQVVFFQ